MVPQFDEQAESAVLGALLLAENLLESVLREGLRPQDFYRRSNAKVFGAICVMAAEGVPVDALSVSAKLEELGDLDVVGGRPGVAALAADIPVVGHAVEYARIVRDKAVLRRLLATACEIQQSVFAGGDAKDLLASAERSVIGLSKVDGKAAWDWDAEKLRVAESYENPLLEVGRFDFPFPGIDAAIRKMRRQGMTVIGAWPGHGKSLLVDQVLRSVAKEGYKAILWDLEMRLEERLGRFVQAATGIPEDQLELTPEEVQAKMSAALNCQVEIRPFSSGTPVEEIARDIRLSGADIAAVDHLHQFPHSTEADVAHVLSELHAAGQDSDSHLVVAAQLRKPPSGVKRGSPVLSDLRYSLMMEAKAANVVFVHQEVDDEFGMPLGHGSMYAPKARHGNPGGLTEFDLDEKHLELVERRGLVSYG